jgi:hypothetical protein
MAETSADNHTSVKCGAWLICGKYEYAMIAISYQINPNLSMLSVTFKLRHAGG